MPHIFFSEFDVHCIRRLRPWVLFLRNRVLSQNAVLRFLQCIGFVGIRFTYIALGVPPACWLVIEGDIWKRRYKPRNGMKTAKHGQLVIPWAYATLFKSRKTKTILSYITYNRVIVKPAAFFACVLNGPRWNWRKAVRSVWDNGV